MGIVVKEERYCLIKVDLLNLPLRWYN